MYAAFLVVTILISVPLMLCLPFLAREAYRTDRLMLPIFRRLYYIAGTILVEVSLIIMVAVVATFLFGNFPLPSNPSLFDSIFLPAWTCLGFIMVVFCLVAVSQAMKRRRQA